VIAQSLLGSDCAQLTEHWLIVPELADRLLELARAWDERFPGLGSLSIISGFRTAEEQQELELSGRPAAPDHISTHRTCPATGADLQLPIAADDYAKAEFGRLVILNGLRWGGGSPVNELGIPADWNHVDLGPRVRSS